MTWRKIVFNEISDYHPIHNQIELALATDPIRYPDVCVGTTYPIDSVSDESDDRLTITAYFSPDAVHHFQHLIAPYPSKPCDAPQGIKLSLSCVDRDRWARILRGEHVSVQDSK